MTVVVLNTRQMTDERLPNGQMHLPDNAQHSNGGKKHLVLGRDIVLHANSIIIWEETLDKEEAMRQLLGACCSERPEIKESSWEALLKRERQGGTFVGDHVAIPHARIEGLQQSLIALGVCRAGIQDVQTGHVVRVMVLLLSPAEPPERHVETLGLISRLVRDDQLRQEVLAARVPMDVMRVFV